MRYLIILILLLSNTGYSQQMLFDLAVPIDDKVLNIEVIASNIRTPNSCINGYTYSVEFDYSIYFTRNWVVIDNPGITIYNLNGSFYCNGNGNYITLPRYASEGTGVSSDHWRSIKDCEEATPERLSCDKLVLNLNTSHSGYSSHEITVNPLPVELLMYDVNYNKGIAVISWKTSSESNNDYFTIEKSLDGNSWSTLDIIRGGGNTNSVSEYIITDNTENSNIIYYKLSQTDFDGSVSVLGVKSLNVDNPKLIKVTNYLGQEVGLEYKGMRILIYEDNSQVKEFKRF